eukprot:834213_1
MFHNNAVSVFFCIAPSHPPIPFQSLTNEYLAGDCGKQYEAMDPNDPKSIDMICFRSSRGVSSASIDFFSSSWCDMNRSNVVATVVSRTRGQYSVFLVEESSSKLSFRISNYF